MNFGIKEYEAKECPLCGVPVPLADRFIVDRETIHKECFNCCYCDASLRIGNASMEQAFFHRFGPRWFCRGSAGSCALLPNAQKEEKLREKGLAQKKVPEKKPQGKKPQPQQNGITTQKAKKPVTAAKGKK